MKTNEDILAKQVYRCFVWVTNLEAIHGEVLPNCFLPRQTIKIEILFQWWLAFKQHNTKPTNTNQKTRANQLILDQICSLLAGGTVKLLNCKSCLKSVGMHGFFFDVLGLFCVVLFEGFLSYKKCLNFLDLSRQKNLSSTPPSMMLPFHAPVLLLMAHEAHGSYKHENFGGILYPRPWIQYPRLWIQDACKVHALMIVT